MKLIVCVSENWGIGYNNLSFKGLKTDLKRFKQMTLNKTVIMGMNTFVSLNYKPLPNRKNIVLTSNTNMVSEYDNLIFCNTKQEVLRYKDADMFIIGGESIYKLFLPFCDIVYVTRVFANPPADKFMPILDENVWKVTNESKSYFENNLEFKFLKYERKERRKLIPTWTII